jgi:hypothetical protein
VAGELERLLGAEHAWPRPKLVLALAIVEAGIAAGNEQEQLIAGPDGQCFRNSTRLDADRLRGRVDRRRGLLKLQQPQVERVRGEPGADRIEAHSPTR